LISPFAFPSGLLPLTRGTQVNYFYDSFGQLIFVFIVLFNPLPLPPSPHSSTRCFTIVSGAFFFVFVSVTRGENGLTSFLCARFQIRRGYFNRARSSLVIPSGDLRILVGPIFALSPRPLTEHFAEEFTRFVGVVLWKYPLLNPSFFFSSPRPILQTLFCDHPLLIPLFLGNGRIGWSFRLPGLPFP